MSTKVGADQNPTILEERYAHALEANVRNLAQNGQTVFYSFYQISQPFVHTLYSDIQQVYFEFKSQQLNAICFTISEYFSYVPTGMGLKDKKSKAVEALKALAKTAEPLILSPLRQSRPPELPQPLPQTCGQKIMNRSLTWLIAIALVTFVINHFLVRTGKMGDGCDWLGRKIESKFAAELIFYMAMLLALSGLALLIKKAPQCLRKNPQDEASERLLPFPPGSPPYGANGGDDIERRFSFSSFTKQ